MKKLVVVMLVALVAAPSFAYNLGVLENLEIRSAKFSWAITAYDFGKIKQGEPVSTKFSFVNTGDEALTILSVKGSCGCTVADYTKGAIAPGATGEVTATYNAEKLGAFNKTVTVTANIEGIPTVLKIQGEVIQTKKIEDRWSNWPPIIFSKLCLSTSVDSYDLMLPESDNLCTPTTSIVENS